MSRRKVMAGSAVAVLGMGMPNMVLGAVLGPAVSVESVAEEAARAMLSAIVGYDADRIKLTMEAKQVTLTQDKICLEVQAEAAWLEIDLTMSQVPCSPGMYVLTVDTTSFFVSSFSHSKVPEGPREVLACHDLSLDVVYRHRFTRSVGLMSFDVSGLQLRQFLIEAGVRQV